MCCENSKEPSQHKHTRDQTTKVETGRKRVKATWLVSCQKASRQINKNVFRVKGLKILGRVGIYIYFLFIFPGKKYNFMHFERHF